MSSRGRSGIALNLVRVVPAALLLALVCAIPPSAAAEAGRPALGPGGPLPLTFEPNQGQADEGVRFLARGRGYGLFLTPTETVLVLTAPDAAASIAGRPRPVDRVATPPAVVRMRMVGADASAPIAGVDPLPGRSHYLLGDPSRWRRDVPTFARVRYTDLYPGVSLLFYGSERALEYDFVVAPGADPGAVVLAFDGAAALRIDAGGDLVLATAAGELRLRRPLIYQETEGGRRPVEGGYVLDGGRVRFRVAAWDATRPLVIDPVLGYSTYLGGSSSDQAFGIAVDALGNAYVTGSTISSDFPVVTPLQGARAGVTDVFVTKLDPTGSRILYSTYLGGSGDEAGNAIAVDAQGSAYVAGSTTSNNFPVLNAFQSVTRGGSEAFVAKLSPDGSTLVFSTYLGSNTSDFAFGIALDAADNVYVTGSTDSSGSSFPNNAGTCLGTKRTGNDAFVVKLNAVGSTLGYCAFIGGAGDEAGNAIAADDAGNVWIAGTTTSSDLPVLNALQPTLGGASDAFVGKLDTGGNLVYLTYLGGLGDDDALAIAVDVNGNAYVTGSTKSPNFPLASPLQASLRGGLDAFVTKLSPAGDALVFSTYLGGVGDDIGNGIAVNAVDFTVYVAGSTGSVDFPTVSPFQATLAGGLDAFVTKLTAAGGGPVYSTLLGGTSDDAAHAIAVDVDGVAYITGTTNSATFPTNAPIQPRAGLLDAFVSQIADGGIIQFTGNTYSVAENVPAGTVTISVQRTGDTSAASSVDYRTCEMPSVGSCPAVVGTAAAGVRYLAAAGTLMFAPGQIVASFPITILNDSVGEGDQTVLLTLGNPTGGSVLGARRTATLTILDDETSINFSLPVYQVNENQGPAVITVTRSGPNLAATVTVDFSTADGSAVAPGDYTAVAKTLTFGPNVRSLTVPVPIVNDTLVEGTETVGLALRNLVTKSGAATTVLGVRNAATLNILDDDLGGSLQFAKAASSVAETGGTVILTVTRTGGAASQVTVHYATSDGTATAGLNYTDTSGDLTFGAGAGSQTFTVPIRNDGIATGNQAFTVTLSDPRVLPPPGPACPVSANCPTVGALGAATVTIVDAQQNISFTTDSFTVRESTPTATITLRRGGATTGAATVDFTTSNGTAMAGVDYQFKSGTLTFAAGATAASFTVPIINDNTVRPSRTVILSLANPTGGAAVVAPSQATLTITDDDTAGRVQFSSATYSAAENAGSALVTLSRSGGTAGGATVQYATSDGTALAGTDYMLSTGTVTFGTGETIKTFSVPLIDNALPDGTRTLNLTLSAPGGGASLGAPSTAMLTIIDDELSFAFAATNYSVVEGAGQATVTVELSGINAVPVTVNYATSDGTATAGLDYTATTGTLVFPAGGAATTVRTKNFAVPILQDTLAEGTETVNLTLSAPTPVGVARVVAARSTAVLSILDDDQGGAVEFNAAAFAAVESGGVATIQVRRTLGLASGVTVDYATSDGTATAGARYVATAGRLTFAVNEVLKTFTIPLINDNIGEGPQTVNLTLTNPKGGATLGGQATAVLTIDDDEPYVRLSAATYAVNEAAGSLVVSVTRGGVTTAQATVDYTTMDQRPAAPTRAVGGVDYAVTSGTLTFAPGVTARTFTVPIINNSLAQPDRKFNVLLRNPAIAAGTFTLVAPSAAEVTINDDDVGGIIQFSSPTYTVNEDGGSAVLTVVRSGGQAGGVSVSVQTQALGFVPPGSPAPPAQTATPGADFTPTPVNFRVTFGPGETTKTVSIPILPDALAEGNEIVYVLLSDAEPSGATAPPSLGTQALATLTIVDAQPTLQFSAPTYTVIEGQPAAVVTVTRTAPLGRLTVDFATSDGTATSPQYYLGASGTLTFDAGVTAQTFSVLLVDNQAIEGEKQFNVGLANIQPPAAASLGPTAAASVVIKDNDRGGTFTVSGVNILEGAAGQNSTALATVSRTGGSGGPVTMVFHAALCGLFGPGCDFPAAPGTDFDVLAMPLTFKAGEMSKTVPVTIHGNDIPQGSRDVEVTITGLGPSVMQDGLEIGPQPQPPGVAAALIHIVEDDLYFVTLSSQTYGAVEGAQQAIITVLRSGTAGLLAGSQDVDMVALSLAVSGAAVAPLDYVSLGAFVGAPQGGCQGKVGDLVARQTITFAANQTTQTFTVPFLDDTVVDGPKTMFVCINDATNTGTPTGPGIAFPASAQLTINDDENGGTIQFAADTYSVADNIASGLATITLTRSGSPKLASNVTVQAQTGDLFAATTPPQTGQAGVDYGSTNTVVTFNAGDTTATFTVPIINNGTPDGVKTVNLMISGPLPALAGAVPVLGVRTTAVLRIVDAVQTVGFQQANFDVSEGAGTATVSLERTGDASGSLTVTFTTSNGAPVAPLVPAVAGVDYQAVNTTITFGPGQTVATATVPLIDNKAVAPDKVANLTLSAPSVGVLATGGTTATLTIQEDDTAGSVSFAAATFVGLERDTQALITLVRSDGTAGCPVPLAGPPPSCPDATLVTFQTVAGGTAIAGTDYTTTSVVVEFGAGETTKTVAVPLLNDGAPDGTETVALMLSNPLPTGVGVGTRGLTLGSLATATLQIVETELRIGATAYTVGEGGGKATLTIVRQGDLTGTSSVTVATVNGTAIAGTDYATPVTTTVNFAAGESVQTLDITVTDDTIVEGDEAFQVVFSNPVGATIASDSCKTFTLVGSLVATCTIEVDILDNDSGGILSFSQPVYAVNENVGTATITVKRIVGGAGGVTVDFATGDGTATAGTDYTTVTQTLTFNAGDTSKTVSVPVLNNTIGVRIANLFLRNATGGATIGAPGTAALQITDLDNSIGFTAVGYPVAEAAGAAAVVVRRTGSAGTVLVDYATSNGTATAPADYAATAGTLTFPAGSTTLTVPIPIVNDAIIEPSETFTVTLSNPRLAVTLTPIPVAPESCASSTATTCTTGVTIIDDDLGGAISFTSANYTVAENAGSAMVTLSRVGGLAGGVTVDIAAVAGTAAPGDFSLPSGTVTFLPGQTTAMAAITINDNLLADADRTVNLTISNPQPAGLAGSPILGLQTTATLTILDNEPRVQFGAASFAVTEGAPAATITVVRTGDPSVEVHVDFVTSDGSATQPARYAMTAGTLTFLPGVSSRTFTVPIVNDNLLQPPQAFNVSLSNPTTVPAAPGRAALATTPCATFVAGVCTVPVTINDDDRAGTMAFNASMYSVAENVAGGTLLVTVTRTGGNAGGVSVNYAATGGTAVNGVDYVLAPGAVTFGVNETVKTFPITIVDNALADGNRTIVLSLSLPSAGALGTPSQATVTIMDDEQTLSFATLGFSTLESAASAVITINRLGTPTGTLLVDFATVDGTATAPADYTAVAKTLTFAAGVRAMTVSVPIVKDMLVEGNETFNVRLGNPRFSPASAVPVAFVPATCGTFVLGPPQRCSVAVTIVDDDQPGTIQFSSATYTVTEGTPTALITLVRTGGVGGCPATGPCSTPPITVDFITADGLGTAMAGADYTPVAQTVTFAANVATQTIAIPITNDALAEGNETVVLKLTNPGGSATLGPLDTATLTIVSNDVAGVVQFSQPLYTVSETAVTATITLTRSGGAASGVTVDFATSNGPGTSGAVAGTDYTALATTVTFGANQTTLPVVITLPGDDATPEGNKIVNLTLSNPRGGAALGLRSAAQLKILDNEATVQFTAPTYSILEGGVAVLTIERTGPPGLPGTIILGYTTSNGTAVAGVNYGTRGSATAPSGTVTFGPGVASQTIRVPTFANNAQDGNHTFNVALAAMGGTAGAVLLPQNTAIVTIVDGDRAGVGAFTAASYSVVEFGSFAQLTVRRSGTGATPVSVAYTTVDGSARAGIDYTATAGVLPFAINQFIQKFNVPIINNNRADGTRSFSVVLSAPTGGMTLGAPATASVLILDDDKGGVLQFSQPTFTASLTKCTPPPAPGFACDAVLSISRTGGLAAGVSIDFATVDGTGQGGTDYTPTTGTVMFAVGQSGAAIHVPLLTTATPLNTFGVILSTPRGGGALALPSTATVTIAP